MLEKPPCWLSHHVPLHVRIREPQPCWAVLASHYRKALNNYVPFQILRKKCKLKDKRGMRVSKYCMAIDSKRREKEGRMQ